MAKDALVKYTFDVDQLLINEPFKDLKDDDIKALRQSAYEKLKYQKKKAQSKNVEEDIPKRMCQNSKNSPGDVLQ